MEISGIRQKIAGFSIFFAKSWRFSMLILISILLLGSLSYTKFLQREGFPEIEVPVVLLNVKNFTGDADKNNTQVTTPIESALKDIDIIDSFQSTTTPVGSFMVINLIEDAKAEEGLKTIKDTIKDEVVLPASAQIEYKTFRGGAIDGTHDLLFTISKEGKSILEMQRDAEVIANELSNLKEVKKANVIKQITEETNANGEEFLYQSQFHRVGTRNQDGKIVFNDAVALGVIKRNQNIGTIELSDAVKGAIENMKQSGVIENYTINYGGDLAKPLKSQISSLEQNALSGLIIVLVISFFFISWRASIISGLFIPTTIATTFIALFVMGYTLNIISLFALILVLGLLVDDVIIVVESIAKKRENGLSMLNSIKEAICEIGLADILGTITTILVFMPMLFISGILGKFILLIPITVIITLIFSLLLALSLFPLLSSITLPKGKPKNTKLSMVLNYPNKLVNQLGKKVAKYTEFYLNSKVYTAIVAITGIVLIFVGTIFAQKLDFNIFPKAKDSDSMTINISYFPGTNITKAKSIAIDVENMINNTINSENTEYVTYLSANESVATLLVQLTPIGSRSVTAIELENKLNSEFKNYKEALVSAESSQAGPPESEYQFFAQIYSNDTQTLRKASEELINFITTKEINNVKITDTAITGLENLTKRDGRRFVEVKARLSDTKDTTLVLKLEDEVKKFFTEEKRNSLNLTSKSIEFDKGQQSENLQSFNSTIFAFVFSLVIMYALLVLQFNSFTQPLLIMFAIPLTFVGLFPGLYFTNNPLSFFVMIGIMGLSGIVVNNTIMLIDFANQAKLRGESVKDSIVHAIEVRFRPLLTTSVTTIAGSLPLALSDPFWEGLSFSIVFGLLASTLLVILVFPSYYVIIEGIRNLKQKILSKII
jgi:multidrug efflux pump subunit AcrB